MKDPNLVRALRAVLSKHPGFRREFVAKVKDQTPKSAAVDMDYAVWQSLQKLSERAPFVLDLLREEPDALEDWQIAKINLAAEYLDAVYDALKFQCEGPDCPEEEGMVVTASRREAFLPEPAEVSIPVPASPVKLKLLLAALLDLLMDVSFDTTGIDVMLLQANRQAARELTPEERQSARTLGTRLQRTLDHLNLTDSMEAKILTSLLLDSLEGALAGWAQTLTIPLTRLNLLLTRNLGPVERAKATSLAGRVRPVLDQLVR